MLDSLLHVTKFILYYNYGATPLPTRRPAAIRLPLEPVLKKLTGIFMENLGKSEHEGKLKIIVVSCKPHQLIQCSRITES